MNRKGILVIVTALCGTCLVSGSARADERLFTYSYQADVLTKGQWEFEQWVTLKAGKERGEFYQWDIREELEYGLTDRLTTAVYLNLRDVHSDGIPGRDDTDKMEFKGISSEWKWLALSPFDSWLGFLLYFEATYEGEELELEQKLVLEKIIAGKLHLVGNVILEQEWEFEAGETESKGKIALTAGLSYELCDNWNVGIEFMNQREYPDYEHESHSAYFLGPNAHYGTDKWWVTLTVMPQIYGEPETEHGLHLQGNERIEARAIAGVFF